LTAAFTTVPAEFSNNTSSFGGDSDGVSSLCLPGPRGHAFGREGLMGGGLGDAFAGSMSAGRGFGHHGPFGGRFAGGRTCDGTFNAGTGWFVCAPVTRNGVTVNQQMQYKTTAGGVQAAFDTASTNSVQVRTNVAGTVSFVRDSTRGGWGGPGAAARRAPDWRQRDDPHRQHDGARRRTVTRLTAGAPSAQWPGRHLRSRHRDLGKGVHRQARGRRRRVEIPIVDGSKRIRLPAVIRVMNATVTFAGETPVTASRRECRYDEARQPGHHHVNGETKNCTMALPRGRPSCS
jgi:hypothetical protein